MQQNASQNPRTSAHLNQQPFIASTTAPSSSENGSRSHHQVVALLEKSKRVKP